LYAKRAKMKRKEKINCFSFQIYHLINGFKIDIVNADV